MNGHGRNWKLAGTLLVSWKLVGTHLGPNEDHAQVLARVRTNLVSRECWSYALNGMIISR